MTQQSTEHKERFTFSSKALAGDSCKVLRFSGTEGLHSLYSFEIILVCQEFIDIDSFIVAPCTLHIARKDDDSVQFHGYPTSCTQNSHSHGWTFYTVQMMPHFSQLRGIVHNAIHVDADVQEIVQESLGHCALMAPEHVFQLQKSYPKQDFSMQYNEDMYAYICYYLERYGIYYYFDQQGEREKVIFTDEPLQHMPIVGEKVLTYSPTSGLESLYLDEIIFSFNKVQIPLPKNVHLRDYDWKNPNAPLEATALVSEKGHGDLFFYGDGFTSVKEGKRLATIRAEALRCQGTTFQGLSSVPRMSPGYLFTLDEHFDQSCNGDFLITQVQHQGSQEAHLSMVLGIRLENPADTVYYRNTFTCIKKEVPFRAPHHTERKKISGMIHAFIDASTDNSTPEIDEFGRYKVLFPQDISGRGAGKASCWLRRAQPSVGVRYGTSFPLDPGVEVLIAFSDGNPDRPFIAAALANAETGSMDSSSRALFSGISTAGGGGLLFNDQGEKQGVNLSTGSMRSGLMMTSGSLDSTILQSDSLNIVSSMSTSSSSSLKNSLSSKFNAQISVNGKPNWRDVLKLVFTELTTLTKVGATFAAVETDAKNNPYDTKKQSLVNHWKYAADALKTLDLAFATQKKLESLTKGAPESPYITEWSAKKDAGDFSIQVPLTAANKKFFIAEFTSHMVAKLALVGASSIAQHKENAQDRSSDDAEKKALEAKFNAEYKKKNAQATEEEIRVAREKHLKYLKGKRTAAQARNWTSQVSSLVSEVISFTALLKSSQTADVFGGVRINSPDANVAIGSASGTHISSDTHIALIAAEKQSQTVTKKSAQALLSEDKKTSENMGLDDDKPTLFGEANGIGFSAEEKIIAKAGQSITIMAQPPAIHPPKLSDENSIFMESSTDITLTATENIKQEAQDTLTLSAKKNMTLTTEGDMQQQAEADFTMQAKANANFSAKGSTTLKAKTITLKAQDGMELKGPWGTMSCTRKGMKIEAKAGGLKMQSSGILALN